MTSRHGHSGERIYIIWKDMKQRCNYTKHIHYKSYGGKGIKVCDEWNKDFLSFYDCVSKLPHYNEKGYTLDRINSNGNYEPNNVRWASAKEQARNRHTTVFVTINGETKSLTEWSNSTGIKYATLNKRYNKYGYRGSDLINPSLWRKRTKTS